jgi:hypothetical protein
MPSDELNIQYISTSKDGVKLYSVRTNPPLAFNREDLGLIKINKTMQIWYHPSDRSKLNASRLHEIFCFMISFL